MPENYIEPLTDRQECFKCHKTVTGKKKLSKCSRCHAITYCGRECQRADWPRHGWNCVPVMVTEIPGKGRGLVVAKDIKKGELLFNEKSSIEIYSDEKNLHKKRHEVLMQLSKLPDGAKEQFHKLKIPDSLEGKLEGDSLTMQKFCSNARRTTLCGIDGGMLTLFYLPLNSALINHSCGPNVEVGLYIDPDTPKRTYYRDVDHKTEVRAVRDISKGEEITKCYVGFQNMINFGSNRLARMSKIQELQSFDCKCFICLGGPGSFSDQEDILKQLRELVKSLDPNHHQKKKVDWEREAQVYQSMADLTEELYMGVVMHYKMNFLSAVAAATHLARDEELLGKAMDSVKKVVEDSQMIDKKLEQDRLMYDISTWKSQLKSKKPPRKEEIEAFLCHLSVIQFM